MRTGQMVVIEPCCLALWSRFRVFPCFDMQRQNAVNESGLAFYRGLRFSEQICISAIPAQTVIWLKGSERR